MYIPSHNREDRIPVMHELVQAHPFATLVTIGPNGLVASHIPMLLDANAGPFGTLRGHVSRANSQWRESSEQIEALAIFSGAQSYVSPSWYVSKDVDGKVVPTWNYAVVHAYGRLKTFDDPDRLRAHVGELTDFHEAGFAEPWSVQDAPSEYVRGLLKGIVGVEMEIGRLEGKWKISQNRPEADQAGVVDGLRALGDANSLAMAELMDRRKCPGK